MSEPQLPTRAAVALFQVVLVQLLESAGVGDIALSDLTVNINGRALRIDVARLTPDGQRIDQWLCGYSIDPHDLAKFGTPVPLPGTEGPTH
jgi:hypothetical protein